MIFTDEWYRSHPHYELLLNMDITQSCEQQFNTLKNVDWREEQPQVDVFCSILPTIQNSNPSMIEVGSQGMAGSFYSVLFEKWFSENCKILNLDPNKQLLDDLCKFWKDKHLKNAVFCHGYVGVPKHYQSPVTFNNETSSYIKMKELMNQNGFETLDILHADIQGSEVSMCEELQADDLFKRIRYFFISTHSSGEGINTFDPCMAILKNSMNCKFHFEDPHRGGWGDGLIVAENLDYR